MKWASHHLSTAIVYLLAAVFLVGCYEVHQGRYVADKIPGWSRRETGVAVILRYPTKNTPDWFIEVCGTNRGTVSLWIGSDAYDPAAIWKSKISFSEQPIRIVFHDENKNAVIPLNGLQTPRGQDVPVGNSRDLTLIIPMFSIGDNVVPELSAHVLWSNDKYRVWVPLQ